MTSIQSQLQKLIDAAPNKNAALKEILECVRANSVGKMHPVSLVRWVPIELVEPNDYNPNSVAQIEMKLLHISIRNDGYTQPVVTVFDPQKKKYVIVDGFHRYWVMKTFPDIHATTGGYLPVVVIEKDIADRMASTVRHNRARGKHSVTGMSNLVFQMLEQGRTDVEICNELGMEAEELLRLKHITGFSKLFENVDYQRAWKMRRQILIEKDHGYPLDA